MIIVISWSYNSGLCSNDIIGLLEVEKVLKGQECFFVISHMRNANYVHFACESLVLQEEEA